MLTVSCPLETIKNNDSRLELTTNSNQTTPPASPSSSKLARIVKYRPATECVLVESTASSRDPYQASSMPVYLTATFKQESALGGGDYDYSRSGNPTRSHVGTYFNFISK